MLLLLAILLCACCLAGILRVRHIVWPLTLRSAWCWGIVAVVAHGTTVFLSLTGPVYSLRTEAFAHFLVAVLLLAPPVTVLGARRPGATAWPWFVTLPMLLVLIWPAVSEVLQTIATRPIQPGTPATVGIIVVLTMATGNYFGTRNTAAASCYAGAVLCHLSPAAGWTSNVVAAALTASTLLCAAVLLGQRNVVSHDTSDSVSLLQRMDHMWITFRDLFGIVWAKRVADRLNQFGQRESWSVRLTLDGFVADDAPSASRSVEPATTATAAAPLSPSPAIAADQLQRPLEVLCWLLKRFADPEWFAEQLREYDDATDESTSFPSAPVGR